MPAYRVKTALLLGGAMSCIGSAPTFAQDTSDGDIVVTAQKRAENVQDVPLAVTVVGAQQLENASVRDVSELTKVAPSLTIRPSDSAQNASIQIRGIGTFAFSPGVESAVAIQIDDVPVAFQARAFADLSDVERIEVLRGPQLDFVRFWSGPGPEDAVFSNVVKGLIEWQDASAHIVNIFPLSPV